MSIALLVIDDGREDYLSRCLASIGEMCPALFSRRILIDDSEHELGFAGAIQAGWDRVLEAQADYVFHVESDFTFNRIVPLASMVWLLERSKRKLAQVALKRQPWNPQEREAGGIVEQHPEDFEERPHPVLHTLHRRFFTTNPSLYPREIVERGWPQVKHSEGIFTHQLLPEGYHFAFLGGKLDAPWVTHTGKERAGVGY